MFNQILLKWLFVTRSVNLTLNCRRDQRTHAFTFAHFRVFANLNLQLELESSCLHTTMQGSMHNIKKMQTSAGPALIIGTRFEIVPTWNITVREAHIQGI